MEPYTVVVTSCGRFDLLEITLRSLIARLEGPLAKILIVEDSGSRGVFDVVGRFDCEMQVVLNASPLGQMASIDRAYAQVDTEWIFHCEDDWEFFRDGFIGSSYTLLKEFQNLSIVSLRPRKEINSLVRNAKTREFEGVEYFTAEPGLHPEYFGYSFNPGLRRLSDYRKIAPLAALPDAERDASYCFKKLGYTMAWLERPAVRHIGGGRHVDDPTLPPRAAGLRRRLGNSARKRLRRLCRRFHPRSDPATMIVRRASRTSAEEDIAPPISSYIRTLNEEARIARTIRAARRVAREVVVVDSGSSDSTTSIAVAEGARVVVQPWLGSGHQKRVGEEACRHEWLLDIDADEVVSAELAADIRKVFVNGEPAPDVCTLPVTTVDPAGRIWRKSRVPYRAKLYDRRKVRIPAHGAWDQFRIPRHLSVCRLNGPLLHYSFDDVGQLTIKIVKHRIQKIPFLKSKPLFLSVARVYCGLPVYFFTNYVLRGLWREGGYGFMAAVATSYGRWCRDAMLHERRLSRGTEKDRK